MSSELDREGGKALHEAAHEALIDVTDVTKVYQLGEVELRALDGISLRIDRGEFVAIMGTSGSGKSTLMNIIGCLDRPTAGRYQLAGREVSSMSRDELAAIRNRFIGFTFQHFNLLPRTSARENVELPLLYADLPRAERQRRASEALTRVGLQDRMEHLPSQLSGGQQQRVAIARAIANRPMLLLADEPTGNLDSRTSVDVMALFQELGDAGMTVVLVTHEPDIARFASRVITLRDGRIASDVRQVALRAAAALPAPPAPTAQPKEVAA
ncbi:MAG TPA: ABC transporter ATP-binding protein [Polyangia bacterium]